LSASYDDPQPMQPGPATPPPARQWIVPGVVASIILVIAVMLVARSLQAPELPTYPPTTTSAGDAGDALVGPVTFTVDAASSDGWTYFDFSRGGVVSNEDPAGWDLAFRRFHVIANGGGTFTGRGEIADMGRIAFDSVTEAPDSGWTPTETRRDTSNAAIAHWYRYSWISHILSPNDHVYVVRTADGRYAKFRILSYYCPGAQPGCVTIEYVYQGSGSRSFTTR
jgi:HmuY protein